MNIHVIGKGKPMIIVITVFDNKKNVVFQMEFDDKRFISGGRLPGMFRNIAEFMEPTEKGRSKR
jgi:hypothetical protein